jgi:hypothetical protein
MDMPFHAIDGYLLDGRPAKIEAIAAALRERVTAEAAQPFYRALEAVGARAADEALIALRLVIAGKSPDDDAVRRLRSLAMLARGADGTAQAGAFAKAAGTLADLAALRDDPAALGAAARAAYHATF